MKKILFLIVAAIVVVAMPNVKADESWLGKVEASIGNDTLLKGELPATTENTTLTYDSVELKYVPADGKTKPGPMAWVGMKVTAPKEVTSSNLSNVKYYKVGDETNVKSFEDLKDGGNGDSDPYYIYIYVSVTQEKLEEACKKGMETLELGKWVFTWDEQGTHKQTFTININTKTVTLLNEENENLFTPTDAEELINEYNESQKQTSQETKTEETKDNTKNPNTSDTIIYSVIAITVSAIGLAFTYKKLHN